MMVRIKWLDILLAAAAFSALFILLPSEQEARKLHYDAGGKPSLPVTPSLKPRIEYRSFQRENRLQQT